MRADIVPGAIFPDYELSDHTAKRRKLSELQGQDPMVLVLGRGGYCPKDRRQAELLVQLHREIEVAYCRLVTITTDNITETNEYRAGVGAHWPFLSDPRRVVQKDLDIAEYTDPAHNPMIPHVIVLEPGLVVYNRSDNKSALWSGPAAPLRPTLRTPAYSITLRVASA
jgi:peroxiredoxin